MSTLGRPCLYPATQDGDRARWRASKRHRRALQKRQKRPKVYHSSQSEEWETPQWFFDQYDAEFHFTLDSCATSQNAKCARYFTKADDGLAQDWSGEICFMNPPYGRGKVDRWIRKAYESSLAGATVVCLVKSTTDTQWYHRYAKPHGEIKPIEGRLKFGGAPHRAPFPSMVVIFRGEA